MAEHVHTCATNHVDERSEPHVCRCGAFYTMDGWVVAETLNSLYGKLAQEVGASPNVLKIAINSIYGKYPTETVATSSSYGKLAREYEKTQSMRMVTVVGDGVDHHVDCDLYTDDHGKSWMISVGEGSGGSVLLTNAQVSELFEFFIRNTEL